MDRKKPARCRRAALQSFSRPVGSLSAHLSVQAEWADLVGQGSALHRPRGRPLLAGFNQRRAKKQYKMCSPKTTTAALHR